MSTAGSWRCCCSWAGDRGVDPPETGMPAHSRMPGGPCQAGSVTSPLPVPTVLIVDDQAPFRFAVKAVLRRLPCFQLAGEAKSGSEAITLVDEVHPALVLMDINMPEMNGIEATRRI